MEEGSIKAAFVLACIQKFADSLTKPTVLVLDNARIHHAKIFQACIEAWEQQGLYIFYLPTYSPHLNKIERLWREAKYRWIPPSAYATLATLRQAINIIQTRFGTDYRINFTPRKAEINVF